MNFTDKHIKALRRMAKDIHRDGFEGLRDEEEAYAYLLDKVADRLEATEKLLSNVSGLLVLDTKGFGPEQRKMLKMHNATVKKFRKFMELPT